MEIINSLEVKQYQVTSVHIFLDDHDNDWHIFDMDTDLARQFYQHSFRTTGHLTKVCNIYTHIYLQVFKRQSTHTLSIITLYQILRGIFAF